jgi:hypothetical protein
MFIISNFQYDLQTELLIKKIKAIGVPNYNIRVIPLSQREKSVYFLDTLTHNDGHSLIDLSFIFGTIFMLLGSIYGFIWLSPIFLGLIGLIFGLALGAIIKYCYLRYKMSYKIKSYAKRHLPELLVIIKCTETQLQLTEELLWKYNALSIGTAK